jgi:hypothetical protein
MTLPRFTTGSIGRLAFSDINAAFGSIDEGERGDPRGPEAIAGNRRRYVVAEIQATQTQAGGVLHKWREMERKNNAWAVKPNGRSSSDGQADYAYPIITLDGTALAASAVVAVSPIYTEEGKLQYLAISTPPGGTFPAKVETASILTANKRWAYQVTEQTLGTDGVMIAGSTTWTAYNLCEEVDDPPFPGLVGVGSGRPQIVTRNPIRQGVGVMAAFDAANGTVFFAMPNGYSYSC